MVFSLQRELSQQRLTFNKRDIPTMTFSSERHPPYNAHLLMKATFSQMSSPFITGVVETLTTEKNANYRLAQFVCLVVFVCFSAKVWFLFYFIVYFIFFFQKQIKRKFYHLFTTGFESDPNIPTVLMKLSNFKVWWGSEFGICGPALRSSAISM